LLEAVELGPHDKDGLLEDVLGILVVGHHAQNKGIDPLMVGHEQL